MAATDQLVERLLAGMEGMWLERPEDVSRMVGRNFDTGKEFSCWAYCWGYLSNLGDLLYTLYGMANEGEGDVATLGALLARRCRAYADGFEAAGHMTDCSGMLREAADGFEAVADHAELARLARALQRYVMQLSFWVDMELPWAEVCEYVDRRWHER